ncbi:glutaredoxin 2 [Clostridium saccharobutylicum]|nr:glutaredoxin 2 [Clostridium saccharobutylicum]
MIFIKRGVKTNRSKKIRNGKENKSIENITEIRSQKTTFHNFYTSKNKQVFLSKNTHRVLHFACLK